MTQPMMPAPEIVTDVDGSVIGQAFDTEAGTITALNGGGFLLAFDLLVVERSDLEALYQTIGQVLERGAAAAV